MVAASALGYYIIQGDDSQSVPHQGQQVFSITVVARNLPRDSPPRQHSRA
jgi:hypothetical protein